MFTTQSLCNEFVEPDGVGRLGAIVKPGPHRFVAGDPASGWEHQCAQVVCYRGEDCHCGYPPDAHDPDAPEGPKPVPRGFSTTHSPDGVRLRGA